MASTKAPEGEKHAPHSKQGDKKKVKVLNSGYHGVAGLKVMKTYKINIHNQEKRVIHLPLFAVTKFICNFA